MENLLKNLKISKRVAALPSQKRNELIAKIADEIWSNADKIIAANEIDLAENSNLSSAMKDRLRLDLPRIKALAQSVRNVAALPEVLGRTMEGWRAKSGVNIEKISVPIGDICVIYESRPNVTAEVAALCLKSGNGCALKGGKEARHTNLALVGAIHAALGEFAGAVAYLDVPREKVGELIKMRSYLDLIVPRGGAGLVHFVSENATVPVLAHDKGVCHVFVDKDADLDKALAICINAKCSRPSACNAAETFLIHEGVANAFLPRLADELAKFETEIFGCEKTAALIPCKVASRENYASEYLDFKVNIRVVSDLEEALAHIAEFGSGHSEAVVSENYSVCEEFLRSVDAACAYANASTRFSDGGEFGFGAEIGISTNKLHARGPVGLRELTTYKYIVRGSGEIR